MQKRLHSKALWTAVFALLLFVSKTYFHYEIPEGNTLVDGILLVMALLGIFNNPTSRKKF